MFPLLASLVFYRHNIDVPLCTVTCIKVTAAIIKLLSPRGHQRAEEAIDAIANMAAEANSRVENIGARRLHTILEKLLEDISFSATDRSGESVVITADYVQKQIEAIANNMDLSKFILWRYVVSALL